MYQIPKLLKFTKLVHGFLTVDEGNMTFKFANQSVKPLEVLKNRKVFLSKLKINIKQCVSMWHQHSDKVVEVNEKRLLKILNMPKRLMD